MSLDRFLFAGLFMFASFAAFFRSFVWINRKTKRLPQFDLFKSF